MLDAVEVLPCVESLGLRFDIVDAPTIGKVDSSAMKSIREPGVVRSRVNAVILIDHGRKKDSKVLQFIQGLTTGIRRELNN